MVLSLLPYYLFWKKKNKGHESLPKTPEPHFALCQPPFNSSCHSSHTECRFVAQSNSNCRSLSSQVPSTLNELFSILSSTGTHPCGIAPSMQVLIPLAIHDSSYFILIPFTNQSFFSFFVLIIVWQRKPPRYKVWQNASAVFKKKNTHSIFNSKF